MSNTQNFFKEKREWSRLKDQILGHYLVPYLTKVMRTKRPIRIVDCFAGKGRFDDGAPGSPLIIADCIGAALTRSPAADIAAQFIEQKYFKELNDVVGSRKYCQVLNGSYEDNIESFLDKGSTRDRNFFFYVDPYGIKYLAFSYFERLKMAGCNTLEFLINFNTTGFLREGCRMLKLSRIVPEWADGFDYETDGKNSPERMDEIAGSAQWRTILAQFQAGQLDFHDAESQFAETYRVRLKKVFKYAITVPIKERANRLPKYRLVFASDHHDGLFLMADEMHKAWQAFVKAESKGQLYLFDDKDLATLQGDTIESRIACILDASCDLVALLIKLIEAYGITNSISEYKSALKAGEDTLFRIVRNPPLTPTGKPARNMDCDKYNITVSPHKPEL